MQGWKRKTWLNIFFRCLNKTIRMEARLIYNLLQDFWGYASII